MNDDEVLSAVRNTLSDVQMDRPVEAIEERGRTRRRNRNLTGVVAGGGLAVAAALALVLPTVFHKAGAAPATSEPLAGGGAAPVSAPAMEPAAFTLATQADGSVKLTLKPNKLLNPAALEKALAGAGIPAVVKAGVLCEPKGATLPEAKEVFGVETTKGTGAGSPEYDLVIKAAKMPKNSEIYFSVFALQKGEGYAKFGKFLVTKGAPMACRTIG